MLIICTIALTIQSFVPVIAEFDVEGKILKESEESYLVDFSETLSDKSKYALSGKPEDYKKVLVKKSKCVKE